jgi:hypothetical protein
VNCRVLRARNSVDLLRNCEGDLDMGSELDHLYFDKADGPFVSRAVEADHHCNFGTFRSGCMNVGFRVFAAGAVVPGC